MPIWIGTADLDRLFSYPQRHYLSNSWFPFHFVAARAHTRPHVGLMICTGPFHPHGGSAAMADALGYLLRNGWFGPGRVAQTLTDCASISALSGYRVAQDRGAVARSRRNLGCKRHGRGPGGTRGRLRHESERARGAAPEEERIKRDGQGPARTRRSAPRTHAPRSRGGGGTRCGACTPRSRHPCVT